MSRIERHRVVIRAAILGAVVVLAFGLMNLGSIGSASWFAGLAAGATLGFLWHSHRLVAPVLGIIGLVLLVATALGMIRTLDIEARAFFNGCSLGLIAGLLASAYCHWRIFRPILVNIAQLENERWLLRPLKEPTAPRH